MFYLFYSVAYEKSISRKNRALLIDKFPSLLLSRIVLHYNPLLSNFRSITCQVVAYGRLKTKENVKLWPLKVVAAAYKRCYI